MLGTNPSSEIQEISSTAKPTKQMEAVEENVIDGKHELEDEIIQEYENEDNIDEENDNINNNDNEGEEETTMTRSITPIPTTQTIPTPEIVIEEPPAPFISQTASILTTSTPNVTLARYDIDVDTDVKECFACGMDIRDESPLAVFGRFWHKDCFRGEIRSPNKQKQQQQKSHNAQQQRELGTNVNIPRRTLSILRPPVTTTTTTVSKKFLSSVFASTSSSSNSHPDNLQCRGCGVPIRDGCAGVSVNDLGGSNSNDQDEEDRGLWHVDCYRLQKEWNLSVLEIVEASRDVALKSHDNNPVGVSSFLLFFTNIATKMFTRMLVLEDTEAIDNDKDRELFGETVTNVCKEVMTAVENVFFEHNCHVDLEYQSKIQTHLKTLETYYATPARKPIASSTHAPPQLNLLPFETDSSAASTLVTPTPVSTLSKSPYSRNQQPTNLMNISKSCKKVLQYLFWTCLEFSIVLDKPLLADAVCRRLQEGLEPVLGDNIRSASRNSGALVSSGAKDQQKGQEQEEDDDDVTVLVHEPSFTQRMKSRVSGLFTKKSKPDVTREMEQIQINTPASVKTKSTPSFFARFRRNRNRTAPIVTEEKQSEQLPPLPTLQLTSAIATSNGMTESTTEFQEECFEALTHCTPLSTLLSSYNDYLAQSTDSDVKPIPESLLKQLSSYLVKKKDIVTVGDFKAFMKERDVKEVRAEDGEGMSSEFLETVDGLVDEALKVRGELKI